MSEEVLRAGEAARRRRKLNKMNRGQRRPREYTTSAQIQKPASPPVLPTMPAPNNWFNIMLGRPLTRPLSAMENFGQFSGLLYIALALPCVLAPNIAAQAFSLQLNTVGMCHSRLAGVYFFAIGLCYLVSARSSPRHVPSKRILLGTVFERLFYVNLVVILIHLKHGGQLLFTCSVMGLDSSLALATLILWFRETTGASLLSALWALKKVIQLLPPSCEPTARKSSSACQIIGYLQGLIGTVYIISPELFQHALKLEAFEGHSKLMLGMCMMCFSVIGILHIFAGAADSVAFNIMAVFYRVVIVIPVICVLFALNHIGLGLAGFYVGFDSVTALIIGLFLYLEGLAEKQQ